MKSFELLKFVENRTSIAFCWSCLKHDGHEKTRKDYNSCKDKSQIHIMRKYCLKVFDKNRKPNIDLHDENQHQMLEGIHRNMPRVLQAYQHQ